MNETLSRSLLVGGLLVLLFVAIAILCSLLEWIRKATLPVTVISLAEHVGGHGDRASEVEDEHPPGGGGNGNEPGQPEQRAAQDGNGGGPVQVDDDRQQEADLEDPEGGGGDQQGDDGGHHQHLPRSSNQAPRTAKVKPPVDEPTETFGYDAAEEYSSDAKSALYNLTVVLLKLLPPKKLKQQQGVSSEPLLNAAV